MARWYSRYNRVRYRRTVRRIAREVDLFWVIDYPRLEVVLNATRHTNVRVVYETVDLVPEYTYHGEPHRLVSLDGERRLLPAVDGFITACESYADYYVEKYGDVLRRRPVVRDNMPREISTQIVPTGAQIHLFFLGSLLFDRPLIELVEAMAASNANATLTLQGKNHLDEASRRRIADRIEELGLQGRVHLLDPCPPEAVVTTANAYDIGVVALRGADENERRASTAKLFTYMAAGLAILGSDLPGIARIVRTHENGVLVSGMDPIAWAVAIDHLGSMPPASIDSMKERSLRAADTYSWDKQESAFVGEFVHALSTPSPGRGL
jgi:glycosyltransferase involved in cell wall biosynthesis